MRDISGLLVYGHIRSLGLLARSVVKIYSCLPLPLGRRGEGCDTEGQGWKKIGIVHILVGRV